MTQDECRPCAFLDRDGVINVDHGYVWRPQDLEFMPGAPEAVAMLNAADYLVVVVTNQSGVARGMYSEINVVDFHSYMHEMLKMHGGHVDAFYYCPYHADAIVTAAAGGDGSLQAEAATTRETARQRRLIVMAAARSTPYASARAHDFRHLAHC